MITNALIADLRQIVSPEYVLDDEQSRDLYGADASGTHVRPGLVVAPGSESEAAGVMALLSAAKTPVTIRGTGTGLVAGAVPAKDGVVLSTARLMGNLRVSREEGTLTASAGIRFAEAQRHAAREGYRLLEPLLAPVLGTIGGLAARNASALLSPVHRHIVGLRAVLASGEILAMQAGMPDQAAHTGGLLLGSEGALGLITEVTFHLTGTGNSERILLAAFDNPVAATHAGAGLMKAGVSPLMADAIERSLWPRGVAWPAKESAGGLLLVWLTGADANIEDETTWAAGICEDYLASETRVLNESERRGVLPAWSAVLQASRPGGHHIPLDICLPPAKLPAVLDSIHDQARKGRIPLAGVARAAEGVLSYHIPVSPLETESYQRAERFAAKVTRQAEEYQGFGLALHGAGTRRVNELRGVHGENDLQAMRTVKEVFDPSRVLHVPAAPAPLSERRNLRRRQRYEEGIREVRSALAAQISAVAAAHEPMQVYPDSWLVLAQIIRICREKNVGIAVDDLPAARLVDVSLSGMDHIEPFEPDTRTIVVAGGVTLSEIHDITIPAGLWCPFYAHMPHDAPVSTILSWDRPAFSDQNQDVVTGLEAVTGVGDRIAWGGMAGTQHAGLRIAELCLGARSRYAVITGAALRLSPLPAVWACVRAEFVGTAESGVFDSVAEAADRIRRDAICSPSGMWTHVRRSDDESTIGTSLILEFDGRVSSVESQVAAAKRIAGEAAATDVIAAYNDEAEDLWGPALEICRPWHMASCGRDLHLVVWCRRGALHPLAERLESAVHEQGRRCRLLLSPERDRMDVRVENAGPIDQMVTPLGAHVMNAGAMLEVWSGEKAGQWIGKDSPASIRLRNGLKKRLDPDGVLSDGWGVMFGHEE